MSIESNHRIGCIEGPSVPFAVRLEMVSGMSSLAVLPPPYEHDTSMACFGNRAAGGQIEAYAFTFFRRKKPCSFTRFGKELTKTVIYRYVEKQLCKNIMKVFKIV